MPGKAFSGPPATFAGVPFGGTTLMAGGWPLASSVMEASAMEAARGGDSMRQTAENVAAQ